MKRLKQFIIALVIVTIAVSANAQVKKETKKKQKSPFKVGFCSTIMPGFEGLPKDTGNTRALANNYKLWDNGKVLYVKFLGNGGSQKIRDKVKKAAKEWEKYANLTFNFIDNGDAHIRILLTNKGGCNSSVGTDALQIDPNEKTMNIDTNFFCENGKIYDFKLSQTIQHEFGHAIGLLHEHFYKNKIPWNKEVVYKEVAITNNWDKEMADAQIFQQYDGIYTNGFQYDKLSIMHYPFSAHWTLNNTVIKSNYIISEKDKETIGLLYPKNAPRANEFPRFSVTNLTPTKVINSSQRNGLVIYPSFKLTTAGRVGKLILIAFLVDPDGYYVISKTNNQNYVGVAEDFNLPPGKQINVNKGIQDFEMFIPFSAFDRSMKNYKILFQIKMVDEINNIKNLLGEDIVKYNQIKSN